MRVFHGIYLDYIDFVVHFIRRLLTRSNVTLSTCSLPLHCIGLNRDLILLSTGNVGASIARVDDFILKELLPAYPSAIIIEDDEGRLPFTEVIIKWISARRAVRLWKSDYKRKKAAAIRRKSEAKARKQQAKMAKRFSVASSGWGSRHGDDDEDYGDDYAAYMETPEDKDDDDSDELAEKDDDDISVESLGKDVLENIREVCGEEEEDDDDEEIHDLPPLVEWSLRVLSAIIDQSPNQLVALHPISRSRPKCPAVEDTTAAKVLSRQTDQRLPIRLF